MCTVKFWAIIPITFLKGSVRAMGNIHKGALVIYGVADPIPSDGGRRHQAS